MKCKVGDLVNIVSGYAFKSKDYTEEGIPVIKIKNIVPPSIDYKDTNKISVSNLGKYEKWVLSYNDILISLTGSNVNQIASAVGKVGRVKTKEKLLLNQRVGKFENISPNELDIDYFYYWISRFDIQYKLASSATGSANQANISPNQIKDLEIELPSIEIQRKVSNILKSLDSKIELNNQMIDTLEEMASTLFKRWFVDFEFPDENGNPYKSSGGKMIDSELGEIPEGWEIGCLSTILYKVNQRFKKDLDNEKYYTPIDQLPMKKITFSNYKSREDAKSSLIKYKENDILLGAMRVYFHRVCLAPFDGITRTTTMVLRPISMNYLFYCLMVVNSENFISFASNTSKGSTIPYAVWEGTLENYELLIPKNNIVRKFNQIIENNFLYARELCLESDRLSELRNTLLPKLLSGEIEL